MLLSTVQFNLSNEGFRVDVFLSLTVIDGLASIPRYFAFFPNLADCPFRHAGVD